MLLALSAKSFLKKLAYIVIYKVTLTILVRSTNTETLYFPYAVDFYVYIACERHFFSSLLLAIYLKPLTK